MADPITTPEPKPAEQQTAAQAVEQAKALSAEESAKVLAALKASNAEAKQYREKLAEIEKAKADAEAGKLAAEGKWKELWEAERKRADEVASKAERAAAVEARLNAIRDAEIADLPETVKARLAKLEADDAIALAREYRTATGTPKAAPAVAGGQPAGSTVQASVSDLAKTPGAYASLPRNQQDAVAKSLGVWRRGSRRAE